MTPLEQVCYCARCGTVKVKVSHLKPLLSWPEGCRYCESCRQVTKHHDLGIGHMLAEELKRTPNQ